MGNENRTKKFLFPVYFVLVLFNTAKERIEYSIRFKLSLRYIRILLSALIWSGIGIVLAFGLLNIYNKAFEDYSFVSRTLIEEENPYESLERYSDEHPSHILLYDDTRNLIFTTGKSLDNPTYKCLIGFARTGDGFYIAVNISTLNRFIPVKAVVYTDVWQELLQLYMLLKVILAVFCVVLLFSIIAIVLSGKGIFQPIREMTRTVKEISEKNLNLRINVGGSKNELKQLAITFNEMMNRIEEHYNRQKQFVSDASHEMRTPIAVIQGYADMLDRWGKNDKEVLQESIDAIKNESENMKDLIDKLLFLARNDKGTLVLQKEEFSLAELVAETVRETQIIDSVHNISFSVKNEVSLYADRKSIKQAVRIFIDNAIKYTPPGGSITISLGEEDSYKTVCIRDTGVGMTGEEIRHIFDRFYRSDKSRTREKGGHGLGLAIAKIIVLGHGGKIRVRSKPGEGTEFTMLLPESREDS
jgi:two-component system sensor histidine kinase ArlS